MKCPVCGFEIDNKTAKCPDCDFNEFKSEFLNLIEYENWMLSVVVPHRDTFVDTLKNDAVNCIQYVKQLDSSPNRDLKKRDIACNMCQKCLDKIDSMVIDWLIKSTAKIEYIEHMGFFDYHDDTTYTFDCSKENITITYNRATSERSEIGTYSNIEVKSISFLRKAFETTKLQDLKHSEDEVLYDDGASWDVKVHLAYPIIKNIFSKESYWQYSERDTSNTCSKIEQWRWENIDTDYLLECSGQFNQAHHLLMQAIGEYIKEPPKNIETIKHDETDLYDVW